MKRIFITIFILLTFVKSYSQKFGESTITVTVSDTTDMYNKVVAAFKNMKFVIKDSIPTDTIVSNSKPIFNPLGSATIRAIIKGNTVTFNGWYADKRKIEITEIERLVVTDPTYYHRIIYFKGSHTWKLLKRVAEGIKND